MAVLVTHDVEEAVTLADLVIVLEGGQIGLEREINIAWPRLRDSPAFAALAQDILDHLLGRTCPSI